MRIVEIREKTIALGSQLRNASIGFAGMTASVVVMVSDVVRNGRPVVGLALDSVGRYGHGGLLRERFMPRILAANPSDYADATARGIDPHRLWALAMQDEKPGGHGERPGAVGLLDAAAWDLSAKLAGLPLWQMLRDRFSQASSDRRVRVYASGGHYRQTNDLSRLADEVGRMRALGFKTVKIKACGAALDQDRRRIDAARKALGPAGRVAVDCNGVLDGDEAVSFIAAVANHDLAWVEEPVDPLDFEALKFVSARTPVPLATGENIFSAADTLNLLRYGGLKPDRDILQVDVSLSYGIVEYLRILESLERQGFSRRQCWPHAGHLFALNVVAGLGLGGHEAAPLGNFPLGLSVEDGHVLMTEAPGVGLESNATLFALFHDLLP